MRWKTTAGRLFVVPLFILSTNATAFAWHDETHLAIAKAADYRKWYNAAGADIAKEKAGTRERFNHFSDLPYDATVTPAMVLAQVPLYNDGGDSAGHLYGAIIGAVREYLKVRKSNPAQYAEYHLAYAAHYIGDLSQPLHNVVHDDFNEKWHKHCDGIVEAEVLGNLAEIRKGMYDIVLDDADFENDLARQVARIANESRKLAALMKKEGRPMTKEEAYRQLARSASLLRAVLHAVPLMLPAESR